MYSVVITQEVVKNFSTLLKHTNAAAASMANTTTTSTTTTPATAASTATNTMQKILTQYQPQS